jgi:menaquinone-9 beta-reductase
VTETPRFDVIIVGASLAGCAAAALFAKRGATVALIEREAKVTSFKKLCTHSIHSSATPALERLGIAALIEAAGGVRNRLEIWTRWGWIREPAAPADRPDHGYNIRREKLDPMLRELAANTPGVEFLLGHSVQELLLKEGRPAAVKTESAHAGRHTVAGGLLVAADGRNSRVAQLAGIKTKTTPHGRFAYFAHYRDLPLANDSTVQTWFLDPDWAGAFANDDGITVAGAMLPHAKLDAWKDDIEGNLVRLFDTLPQAPSLRNARRVSPVMGALELPNIVRPAARPGIALIGDAALAADPLWGVGCGFAFQSAEWLVDSVADALGDPRALDRALVRYRRRHSKMLDGHEFLMADYARARPFNTIERLMYSAAARDAFCAANLLAFGTRNIRPSRFLSPRALLRSIAVDLAHGLRSTPDHDVGAARKVAGVQGDRI